MNSAPANECAIVSAVSGDRVAFVGSLTLGRHPTSDLVLGDPEISARHAVIEFSGDRWVVRDLGSSNGTSVNGRRIQGSRAIKVGDRLRFGGASGWIVQALAEVGSAPVAATARAGRMPQDHDLDLHLTFEGPADGTVRVVHPDGEWSAHASQSFVLLVLLARAGGGWVDDEDLKVGIWGRARAVELDRSSLNKLIHDTRQMFQSHGTDGWCIEKRPGRTRLRLAPARLHLREGS